VRRNRGDRKKSKGKHKELNTAVKILVSLSRLVRFSFKETLKGVKYRMNKDGRKKNPINSTPYPVSSVKITQLSLVILLGNDDPN